MVSNKMIHYEKILALKDHALHTEHKQTGFNRFVAQLNDIEKFFKLLDDSWDEHVDQDGTALKDYNISDSWKRIFNQWFEGIIFDANLIESEFVRLQVTKNLESNKQRIKQELIALYSFKSAGKRVFKATKDVCEMLNNTRNTESLDHLRTPYDIIYISFPSGLHALELECSIGDTDLPYQGVIRGAYAGIDPINKKMLLGVTWSAPPFIDISQKYMLGTSYKQEVYNLNIGENKTVEDFLNMTSDSINDTVGIDIMKTILNILTYISCTNASIDKINSPSVGDIDKKRFAKHPERVKSRLPYYSIGGDIQINNKPTSGGEATGTGRSLTTRFTVRAHFHSYWKIRTEEITDRMVVETNDDGKILVRKWIAPYWKGPEYGDVILKNYKVTT